MRLLVQRVSKAQVTVDSVVIGKISKGLLVFIGIAKNDGEAEAKWLGDKLLNLRVFPSEKSGFDHSISEINGELLLVSQFTLYGNCTKGRRPDFIDAASPEDARKLYGFFVDYIKSNTQCTVETGKFQAMMNVDLTNDGPVTLILERSPDS